jgi:hypothetical protein
MSGTKGVPFWPARVGKLASTPRKRPGWRCTRIASAMPSATASRSTASCAATSPFGVEEHRLTSRVIATKDGQNLGSTAAPPDRPEPASLPLFRRLPGAPSA